MKTKPAEDLEFEILTAMDKRQWRRIEELVNADLRHRTDSEPFEYLRHWCNVARIFAVATQDYTWGEFEKEFAIIIKRVAKGQVLADLVRQFLACDPAEETARWCELSEQIAKIVDMDDEYEHPEAYSMYRAVLVRQNGCGTNTPPKQNG
jgi:sulfatase maturation enzyme AslB (radical SAM superfamily)